MIKKIEESEKENNGESSGVKGKTVQILDGKSSNKGKNTNCCK